MAESLGRELQLCICMLLCLDDDDTAVAADDDDGVVGARWMLVTMVS